MGQKVNPTGFRLGGLYTWTSRWYANPRVYRTALKEDVQMRRHLKTKLKDASLAKIEIERNTSTTTITLHTAKPGMVIGRGGQGVEDLQAQLRKFVKNPKATVKINIQEVDKPNLSAALTVQAIAADIEKRMPFRRTMKQALNRLIKAGAAGAKIEVSGRLNGAEIARSERLTHGTLPLHTLRADIDYSRGVANTTYGVIGIKVWVYRTGNEVAEVSDRDFDRRRPTRRREAKSK